MKTRCLDTHQELEWSACLSCALKPHHCDYNYALLKSIHDDQQRERSEGWHVSDIKGCLKRSYFSRLEEAPADYPSEKMAMWQGSTIHAAIAHQGDEMLSEKHIEWTYGGIKLSGTFDAFYPQQGMLSDTKTTRWITMGNLPYADHAIQVQIYANMMLHLGYPVSCAEIQYVDLSGPSKCKTCSQTLLPYDDDNLICPQCEKEFLRSKYHLGTVRHPVFIGDALHMDGWITSRLKELNDSVNDKWPPSAEPSFLCRYCPFNTKCPEALK